MAGRPKGNEKTGQLLNLAIETQQQAMPYNKKSKSGINHRILVHFTPAVLIRFARLSILRAKQLCYTSTRDLFKDTLPRERD